MMKVFCLIAVLFVAAIFSPVAVLGQTTYTWIGGNSTWTTATNWIPTRTTPATNDILVFNDGTISSITAVPTQTIGQFIVSNATTTSLNAGVASNVLTIGGGVAGTDLDVASG